MASILLSLTMKTLFFTLLCSLVCSRILGFAPCPRNSHRISPFPPPQSLTQLHGSIEEYSKKQSWLQSDDRFSPDWIRRSPQQKQSEMPVDTSNDPNSDSISGMMQGTISSNNVEATGGTTTSSSYTPPPSSSDKDLAPYQIPFRMTDAYAKESVEKGEELLRQESMESQQQLFQPQSELLQRQQQEKEERQKQQEIFQQQQSQDRTQQQQQQVPSWQQSPPRQQQQTQAPQQQASPWQQSQPQQSQQQQQQRQSAPSSWQRPAAPPPVPPPSTRSNLPSPPRKQPVPAPQQQSDTTPPMFASSPPPPPDPTSPPPVDAYEQQRRDLEQKQKQVQDLLKKQQELLSNAQVPKNVGTEANNSSGSGVPRQEAAAAASSRSTLPRPPPKRSAPKIPEAKRSFSLTTIKQDPSERPIRQTAMESIRARESTIRGQGKNSDSPTSSSQPPTRNVSTEEYKQQLQERQAKQQETVQELLQKQQDLLSTKQQQRQPRETSSRVRDGRDTERRSTTLEQRTERRPPVAQSRPQRPTPSFPSRQETSNQYTYENYRKNNDYTDNEMMDSDVDNDEGSSIAQKIATFQSFLVGALVGAIAFAPFSALNHFVIFPSYEGVAQWEWDTGTSLVQGGLFAIVYRYCLRNGDDFKDFKNVLFMSFVLIRSLVGVHVPMHCTALPLQCGEPFEIMDWTMIGELSVNFLESFYLFGTVGAAMDFLLKRDWIFRLPS